MLRFLKIPINLGLKCFYLFQNQIFQFGASTKKILDDNQKAVYVIAYAIAQVLDFAMRTHDDDIRADKPPGSVIIIGADGTMAEVIMVIMTTYMNRLINGTTNIPNAFHYVIKHCPWAFTGETWAENKPRACRFIGRVVKLLDDHIESGRGESIVFLSLPSLNSFPFSALADKMKEDAANKKIVGRTVEQVINGELQILPAALFEGAPYDKAFIERWKDEMERDRKKMLTPVEQQFYADLNAYRTNKANPEIRARVKHHVDKYRQESKDRFDTFRQNQPARSLMDKSRFNPRRGKNKADQSTPSRSSSKDRTGPSTFQTDSTLNTQQSQVTEKKKKKWYPPQRNRGKR